MDTLARICETLNCEITDVIEFISDEPIFAEGNEHERILIAKSYNNLKLRYSWWMQPMFSAIICKKERRNQMSIYTLIAIMFIIFMLTVVAIGVYLLMLIIKALKKYIGSKEVREEKKEVRKSLAELLRENRLRCKMTQEFVSETLGVSRQAVSKWENGTTDPSTSNLMALAKLYGVSAEDLLRGITESQEQMKSCQQEENKK